MTDEEKAVKQKEVEQLKIQLFDIIREQGGDQQRVEQLERAKQQGLNKLVALEKELA